MLILRVGERSLSQTEKNLKSEEDKFRHHHFADAINTLKYVSISIDNGNVSKEQFLHLLKLAISKRILFLQKEKKQLSISSQAAQRLQAVLEVLKVLLELSPIPGGNYLALKPQLAAAMADLQGVMDTVLIRKKL